MHRFLVPSARHAAPGDMVPLGESDARHAVQVLRLGPGAPVTLLDGAGGEHFADLAEVGRREVTARIGASRQHVRRGPTRTLAAGLAKGKAWDLILQKATELGVHRIVPLACERSVAVVDPQDAPAKRERWALIVAEAAKQCGTPWLPDIELPVRPAEWAARGNADSRVILADLTPGAVSLAQALAGVATRPEVVLLVGPEGDFSPSEKAVFQAAGAVPVTLGPRVLRAETAAAAMLAVLEHELQRATD